MSEPNPYEPPQTESDPPKKPDGDGYRYSWRFLLLVLPALLGAFLGSILLAPFARGPGDPVGHSIGAGWGGFLGLLVGIWLRIVARQR